MKYKFTIEKASKTYHCERVVTGKGELRQLISVASKKHFLNASKFTTDTEKAAGFEKLHNEKFRV